MFAQKENRVPSIFPFSFLAPVAQVGKYIIQMLQKKVHNNNIDSGGPVGVEVGLNQYLWKSEQWTTFSKSDQTQAQEHICKGTVPWIPAISFSLLYKTGLNDCFANIFQE